MPMAPRRHSLAQMPQIVLLRSILPGLTKLCIFLRVIFIAPHP
jgi:hypothetical protein